MARPANKEGRDRARALCAQGVPRAEIAEILGASRSTVNRWCEGLPPEQGGTPARPLDLQAITKAREEGATWREVAELAGMSKSQAHLRAKGLLRYGSRKQPNAKEGDDGMNGLRETVTVNGRNRKLSDTMRAVLAVIVDAPGDSPAWGFSACESTGIGPGRVYPALEMLLKAGLIADEWEAHPPSGRLPRRHYRPAFDPAWYRANGLLRQTGG